MQKYRITVGDQIRDLPLIPISDDTAIASFVLLGDDAMSRTAAELLIKKLPHKFDYVVTVESKGITLAHDISLLTNHPRSFVIRKSVKSYMKDPLTTTVDSITTQGQQQLVLDGADAKELQGKSVILVDDVVSTGGSLQSAEKLLKLAGCQIIAKATILAEGDAAERDDVVFLGKLPLFNLDGTIK
ncbi:phosphoribosyltransferase family protein [Limosilactobacillus mucosae]|uniref:Adenine phosphoribosyltransferase n=1 Tax=Limosilactobacillus mucosae LM1 TaxID=1130798 RepID=A0A0D4CLI4_LIMMU|nr:phosphoribosyltransferase family protein [Limosilactobacillus mucosae]AJT50785.1 adenine phosphoribosyltransferase [Limosilactobacillus mucosae LM1]MDC2845665.1 phosphoribosyltransferase family protein [Limosilactobacillus mucosae]